jgi:hypothetical protein
MRKERRMKSPERGVVNEGTVHGGKDSTGEEYRE